MSDPPLAYALDDVAFAYDGAPVLSVPRLEIPCGEIVALAGANGSGKTTLLHLLAFLEAPASGRIVFFGDEARPEHALGFRRRVGLLLQEPYLFHTSVRANVEYGLRVRHVAHREAHARALAALDEVGLGGFEDRAATQLSGGERKRVALARILALGTEVLLLDEPMAHVDDPSARRIEEVVRGLNREGGKTIVVASHDRLWAHALADRVLSLHEGRLVPGSLVNVFRGTLADGGARFETGRIAVSLGRHDAHGSHLAIDPTAVVLSHEPLASSMRNTFEGRVVAIREEGEAISVEVDAGERFRVQITGEALADLDLRLGGPICLSFKSTAAHVF